MAEETLAGLAKQHSLTAGQIASVQNLTVNGNLEERPRAGRIFGAFVQTLPSYQAIASQVGTQLTRAPRSISTVRSTGPAVTRSTRRPARFGRTS